MMMKIGFLGLGKMGSAVAGRLLAAGHSVTVWNRSRDKADALKAQGACVAETPAEAVRGQDAVFTMLMDDAAHEAVIFGQAGQGDSGFFDSLEKGAVHASLSTVSVELSKRMTAEHDRRGQLFVGAPVFGRPNVAAEGKLWIALAGAVAAIARIRPLLEPLSRGNTVVGLEPWQAHALKLGGNFMITAMVQTLSEAFVYALAQGIEPDVFLSTVNSALFQSPFYATYGGVMLHPPEQPGATVALGLKDTKLFRSAASEVGLELGLAGYLQQILESAVAAGLTDGDWAVGQYKTSETLARQATSAK